MSLIIATGSNIGDSVSTLRKARDVLSQKLSFIAQSRIYLSNAVDYEDQPDFYNQVLEFALPEMSPDETMTFLLETEKSFGRLRDVHRGPRTLDLDIIFWGMTSCSTPLVTVPHPRWIERSFVVRPLQELPFFQSIKNRFIIPQTFSVEAAPLQD